MSQIQEQRHVYYDHDLDIEAYNPQRHRSEIP